MKRNRSAALALLYSVIIALNAASPAAAQQILSLHDAIERSLSVAEDVEVARLRVDQAGHAVSAVRAQRLPSLSLSASYNWVSETAGIDFQIPGLLSRRISFGDGNIYDAGLTAAVPLFTGFRLARTEEAQRQGTITAKEALRAKRIETAGTVTAMYRKAQLARMAVRLYDEQLRSLAAHQRMIVSLLGQGQALSYDTLVISTRLMAIEVSRASSESDYRNALRALAVLLAPDGAFDVDENVLADDAFVQSGRTALLASAVEQRPDLRQLESQIAMQRGLADAERSSLYPTVSAAASARYGKPGVDQVSNEWMGYYTAGISMQWNLWSWGSDKHKIESREIEARTTELRLAQLHRKIDAEISSLLDDLDVLKKNISLLDRQIAQEQEKFQLIGVRVREGLVNTVELVDAETSLTTATLARQRASILYALKVNELAVSLGREF